MVLCLFTEAQFPFPDPQLPLASKGKPSSIQQAAPLFLAPCSDWSFLCASPSALGLNKYLLIHLNFWRSWEESLEVREMEPTGKPP